jgi:hypothetical protein
MLCQVFIFWLPLATSESLPAKRRVIPESDIEIKKNTYIVEWEQDKQNYTDLTKNAC